MFLSHGSSNSRGVCTIISNDLDYSVNECVSDENGRFILLDLTLGSNNLILLNVYAPTKDKLQEQNNFLKTILDLTNEYIGKNIIIGGDFNTCLNPQVDKKGGKLDTQSCYNKDIHSFIENFDLCYIWRIRNPNTQRYTWQRNTISGIVQSRLDFFLVSMHLQHVITCSNISPSINSDHSLISFKLTLTNQWARGKVFFKFNTSLLTEDAYIERVNNCFTEYQNNQTMENKGLEWDYIKCTNYQLCFV